MKAGEGPPKRDRDLCSARAALDRSLQVLPLHYSGTMRARPARPPPPPPALRSACAAQPMQASHISLKSNLQQSNALLTPAAGHACC